MSSASLNSAWLKPVKAETPRVVEVVQVVHTKGMRGDGMEEMLREVDQYWAFDGTLLAESDPGRREVPRFIITLPEGSTQADVERWRTLIEREPPST